MTTSANTSAPPPDRSPPPVSFRTALGFWLKLGFISFGGPAGQIAVMHTELVERRRWISERRFLHALNYCMVLPGPEAQQLATYIGWLLHGTWGGIVAGGLFVLPSLFILMGLSWIYMAFGDLPLVAAVFDGVKPAVVAVVAFAVIRIGGRAIKNVATLAIAAAALVLLGWFETPFPLIVLGAGLLGFLGGRIWPEKFALGGGHGAKHDPHAPAAPHAPAVIDDHHAILAHTRPSRWRFVLHLTIGLALWGAPLGLLTLWQGWNGTPTQMGWFFSKAALVTFGGAYAVLPYISQHAVHERWLTGSQMIDGLALGETTPGPLIMVVAFVGYVGGWQQSLPVAEWGGTAAEAASAMPAWLGGVVGCVVATYFTFLPSFLFILLGAPLIERMRGEIRLTAVLSGITAAVVGMMLNLAIFFGQHVFFPHTALQAADAGRSADVLWGLRHADGLAIAVAAAAFVALRYFKIDIVRVVLACGAIGLVARLVGR